MRIIARLNVGGPAVHCETLSKGLNAHGFSTILVAGSTETGEASYEELFLKKNKDYRLIKLPGMRRALNFLGDFDTLFRLIRLIYKERPQIVHTHTAKAGFLGRLAALFTGVPIVVHTYHGHVLSGYFSKIFSSFITLLERLLARHSDALVTLSPQLKSILSDTFRVAPAAKFRIVPLGRDLKPFLEMPRKKGIVRRELGISNDIVLMGIVGRLVPIKNHSLLFDSLEALDTTAVWQLLVIGEGILLERLKERVAHSLRLRDRIRFLGWRKDLPELYSDLDISLLASNNEGTPLSIIESFASGCPVLSTDVGGVRDMFTIEGGDGSITQCSEGILVPSQEVSTFMKGLKFIMEENAYRERCSVAGRWRAMAYSEEMLAQRMADLYRELLQTTVRT